MAQTTYIWSLVRPLASLSLVLYTVIVLMQSAYTPWCVSSEFPAFYAMASFWESEINSIVPLQVLRLAWGCRGDCVHAAVSRRLVHRMPLFYNIRSTCLRSQWEPYLRPLCDRSPTLTVCPRSSKNKAKKAMLLCKQLGSWLLILLSETGQRLS